MKKLFITSVILLTFNYSFAQVAINTDGSTANSSAALDVKSTNTGLLVPRMTSTQRAAISSPATGLLVFDLTANSFWFYNGSTWVSVGSEKELPTTANAGDMNYWNGTAWVVIPTTINEGATLQMINGVPTWTGGTPPPVIGAFRDGGVVFYIDGTGKHGYVVDIFELNTAPWGCVNVAIPGANGSTLGSGAQNTIDIENGCATVGTAADLCANSSQSGYTDWFLPSTGGLGAIYANKAVVNAAITAHAGTECQNIYWSSSERDNGTAWIFHFYYNNAGGGNKITSHKVRAIRAF